MGVAILTFKLQEHLKMRLIWLANTWIYLPSFFPSFFLLVSLCSSFFLSSLTIFSFFLSVGRELQPRKKKSSLFCFISLFLLQLSMHNKCLSFHFFQNHMLAKWFFLVIVAMSWLANVSSPRSLLASNLFAKYWLGLN